MRLADSGRPRENQRFRWACPRRCEQETGQTRFCGERGVAGGIAPPLAPIVADSQPITRRVAQGFESHVHLPIRMSMERHGSERRNRGRKGCGTGLAVRFSGNRERRGAIFPVAGRLKHIDKFA